LCEKFKEGKKKNEKKERKGEKRKTILNNVE